MEYDHFINWFKRKPLANITRSLLYAQLIPGGTKSVVEFGSGFGYLARACKRAELEYTGYEFNEKLYNLLKDDFNIIKLDVFDTHSFDIAKGDVYFAEHFIEHAKDYNQLVLFLKHLKSSVMKKDDLFIILYPDIGIIGANIYYHDPQHIYPLTKNRLHKILQDVEFDIVKSGCYTLGFKGMFSYLISIISKLPFPISIKLNFLRHRYIVVKIK